MARRSAPSPDTYDQARRRLFAREAEQIGNFAMIAPQRAKASSGALQKVGEVTKKPRMTADRAYAGRAFELCEEVGELGYIQHLTANTAAACLFEVQELDGEGDWVTSENEAVRRVDEAFVGPLGGRTELIRRAALHLGIVGETMLYGAKADGGKGKGIWWEFLSTDELRVKADGTMQRYADGGSAPVEVSPDSYVARCWRSHPRFSNLPDSPMRRAATLAEEVVTLSQLVEAVTRSRLAAGVFYVPEEITFVPDDVTDDTAPDGIDPFIQELIKHLTAPIADRASVSSLVPLVVRGPADYADKLRLIDLSRNLDGWARELRSEALHRLAGALDIDPAIMKGKAGINHWGAYIVDQEFATKHVAPTVGLLSSFLTVAYLRPMLETFEGMKPEQSAKYRYNGDISTILARPDEAASARALHLTDNLSDEALVRANGFTPGDMPDDEELRERRMWALLRAQPVQLGPVLGPALGIDVDWSKAGGDGGGAAGDGAGSQGPSATAVEDAANPTDATSGAEMPEPAGPVAALAASAAPVSPYMLVDRIATAADAAFDRAMERAGSRVVTKGRTDVSLRDRLRSVDKSQVLTLVRPSELDPLGLDAEGLFAEAWDALALRVRPWVRSSLESRGVGHLAADDTAALAASALCERMQAYAVEHMHATAPLWPNGLRVPDQLVIEALVAAGAL